MGPHDPRLGTPRGRRAGIKEQVDKRHQLRRAHRARGRAGAPRLRGRPVGRARAHGQLGHRGDDERRARRPRVHRAREDRQVHRLLPRPLGRLPRRRGQRRAHARAARQPRRDQGHHGGHAARRVQRRRRRSPSCSRSRARRSPRSSSSRWPATWASSRRSPASSRPAASCAPSTAPCWSSTRSSPASASAGAARRSASASCPTSRRSARSSAAACPSARSAAAARSWRRSRRSARRTRPARSRGTRWPWPPGAATLRVLAEPGTYERLEASGARVEQGLRRGRRRGGPRRHHQPGRAHAHDVLLRGSGAQLRRRQGGRHRRLRRVLAAHARGRRLPRAVAVRGGDDLAGAHRRGPGQGCRRRARLVQPERGPDGARHRQERRPERHRPAARAVPAQASRASRARRRQGLVQGPRRDDRPQRGADPQGLLVLRRVRHARRGLRGAGAGGRDHALPGPRPHVERDHRRRRPARHRARALPRVRGAGLPPRRHVRQLGHGDRRALRVPTTPTACAASTSSTSSAARRGWTSP